MIKLSVTVDADEKYCIDLRGNKCELRIVFAGDPYCHLWRCVLKNRDNPERCQACLGAEIKDEETK